MPGRVFAADFKVTIDREYNVAADGTLRVIETHTVRNETTERRVIKSSNEETFQISVISGKKERLEESVNSVNLTIDGVVTTFNVSYQEDKAIITIGYPREITKNQQIVFRLEYSNFGLVEQVGALYDIYAPGFAEDIQFVIGNTEVTYNTKVKVSSSLPEENFVFPDPGNVQDVNGFKEYIFTQDTLVGKTIWIQRGKTQYYQFKIQQKGSATDTRNTGYLNEYRLVLPRDIDEGEVNQKVYFSNITPEPKEIIKDKDDNIIGVFKFPSHETSSITVEGFAAVGLNDLNVGSENSATRNELSADFIKNYTGAAEFWEVENAEIQKTANEIAQGSINIYELVDRTYTYVVNSIDYSEVKRFGLNQRQGALKTLKQGAGVCMEYSDLFLTLMRAQGIPARAVFGYGYDSKVDSTNQEAHQWVNVYIPGISKWISIDVTWGESGDTLIGGDLNHFYTHVASSDPNTPPMVERVSFGNEVPLQAPEFEISAVGGIENVSALMSQSQLLSKYPVIEKDDGSNNFEKFFSNIRDKLAGLLNNSQDKQTVSIVLIICGGLLVLLSIGILGYLIKDSKRLGKGGSAKAPSAGKEAAPVKDQDKDQLKDKTKF